MVGSRMLVAAITALGMALAPAGAAAQGGKGGGQGRGGGQSRPGENCGGELVTVLPDGTKRVYAPASAFLQAHKTVSIDQGEQPRTAARLSEVLSAVGAAWVEALDCTNESRRLPSGLPFEGEEYLVVTGRGTFKIVREARPGSYANVISRLRKLTFHGASQPAPGQPAAKP